MTTYFTPVGTLAELTRAKGSDVNAREAAVESGFTAIEAAIAPSDGLASIVAASGWGVTTGRLKKMNTLVTLQLKVTGTGGGGATLVTLPVGYRPAVEMEGIPSRLYYVDTTSYSSPTVKITTAGAVSCQFVAPSAAAGDIFWLYVSFWTT